MFTIKYTVFNVDTLTEKQRARYDRCQAIIKDELIKKYGRVPRGVTLNMETYREMLAREVYEDSLLEDYDRLIMRVGAFAESYFHKLGDKQSDCSSVYEIDFLRDWQEDLTSKSDRLFKCYLAEYRECVVRVSGNKLTVVQSFCDRRYLSYDDQPF